jgi:hypothetical protein
MHACQCAKGACLSVFTQVSMVLCRIRALVLAVGDVGKHLSDDLERLEQDIKSMIMVRRADFRSAEALELEVSTFVCVPACVCASMYEEACVCVSKSTCQHAYESARV